ncbi:spore germination protein GerW family protein [Microbispora sp. NPDC049633]|uniref:spore germination protein GerW family protein n=1 Tax=Microbispora sp. NPDC049633 TaxID=3154355 RepID=UPI0034219F3A
MEQLLRKLTGQRVFGEPYEKDGVTFIPVVAVRAGGGFGRSPEKGGEARGGGGGVVNRPVGMFVLKDDDVQWRPALDLNRVILGGQILAGLALVVYAVTRHAR